MELRVRDITLPRRAYQLQASLNIGSGTVALVGPSGAGKTSLLRAIAGLEHPSAGHIALDDEIWFDSRRNVDLPPERRRVGYVPQDYALFPHLSVTRNVKFAARKERPELLERLGIAHLAQARPVHLSGGERQRVALARALARGPRVLLLDEPFAALDPLTRAHVRDELSAILAGIGLPTLLVTHTFEDAAVLSERVGVIDHGQIVQLDTLPALQCHPATPLVAELTGTNVLHGTATPTHHGAMVQIDGGGRLHTTTACHGRVTVSVPPWTITPTPPEAAPLSDTITAVYEHAGRSVLKLTRLAIHLPSDHDAGCPLEPGTLIGLTVPPDQVHVIADSEGPVGAAARRALSETQLERQPAVADAEVAFHRPKA